MMLASHSTLCADPEGKQLDEESLRNYMAGEYDLIGRKADSTATYNGHVTLRDEGGVLQVARKVRPIHAQLDSILCRRRSYPVLKMHFLFDGKEYEAPYHWQSDPDNYPRLTGYVYLAGTKSPGLEALFPIHQ